ncbi:hypothetical protein UCRPC4_g02082 [Phaeomoniella chlamydospora]|uniref:Uncharacterized protein n=1 Tax=Phaeomoniella chlamydospora TaxID=158046 RepID=A0A0G2H8T0_PHACM|nr:hypothetical protein UCRPC4_g02082 [Phaeomoniella chlamydospora]
MTSLLIGPIYLTYEKIKEHRDGKRRIRNIARYEDLRREHEGEEDVKEDERWRLDQQRMKTGFAIPEPSNDGRVRLSHDWEAEREREWAEREMRERSRHPSSLRASRTGSLASRNQTGKRESWHGDYRPRLASEPDWENGRVSPGPRRSLQVGRLGREFESDSLSDRSSAYNRPRSDMSRSRDFFEPQQVEVPKPHRQEEPKDMSSLFVDDILRERGLA